MKLLVTGAGGQLGLALQSAQGVDLQFIPRTRQALDIADGRAVAAILRDCRPDVVVNAAAYTAVDRAETEIDAAYRVNGAAPRLLAMAAVEAGIPFIHISTDLVFDGTGSRPYRPTDPENPLNVYGASKLAGERAALDADPGALIIRTSWLYRLGSRNFVTTILRLLRQEGMVRVVADQYGSPTSATGLAYAIVEAASRLIAAPGSARADLAGIRHFADLGVASRHEFAVAIRDEAVAAGLVGAAAAVEPVASVAAQGSVRRPAYGALDSSQIRQELGLVGIHWREALAEAFQNDFSLLRL